MSKKIAIVTDGTWGDVLPFIFLGRELSNKGYRVKILCNEYYKEICEDFGLFHISTTDKRLREEILSSKKLWKPFCSFSYLSKKLGILFDRSIEVVKKGTRGADLIIGHSMVYSAKTCSEIHNIEYVSLLISPIQARTLERLPVFYKGINPNSFPRFIKKYFYKIGDTLFIDQIFKKSKINKMRLGLGLKEIKGSIHWGAKAKLAIGLWSDWYADIKTDQKDWLALVGFPKKVEMGDAGEEILDWVKKEKPIVFTMGSGFNFIDEWHFKLEKVSEEFGQKILILGPGKKKKSKNILYKEKIKLSKVLPFCTLCIHHGGAGMVAQVASSGIPSLIIPMAHDQPDNAHLMEVNNLGKILWSVNPSAKKVIEKIYEIMEADHIYRICQTRAEQIGDSKDGISMAVELIEEYLKK